MSRYFFQFKINTMKLFYYTAILFCLHLSAFKLKAQSFFSSPLIGVGVVVTDLVKSLAFYVDAIGMEKLGVSPLRRILLLI